MQMFVNVQRSDDRVAVRSCWREATVHLVPACDDQRKHVIGRNSSQARSFYRGSCQHTLRPSLICPFPTYHGRAVPSNTPPLTVMTSIVLLLVLVSIPFYATAAGYIIRYVFRTIGLRIKSKTSERRKLILARVKADEQNYQSKHSSPPKTDDEDWEKIEGYAVPTAPNGDVPGDDWEGIIGFFHPFAYVPPCFLPS